jgi:hypothetical protein
MRILSLIILFFCAYASYAQPTEYEAKAAVKTDAQRMGFALVSKDFYSFVKFTYPKAVEKTGAEKMEQMLASQVAGMEKNNNKILAAWPGEPSAFIDTAGELQCTIPQKMKLELDNGTLITETTLLATSTDQGRHWYFMDAADRSIEVIRSQFPNFSSKHILTKSPEPKFEPKKEAPAKAKSTKTPAKAK